MLPFGPVASSRARAVLLAFALFVTLLIAPTAAVLAAPPRPYRIAPPPSWIVPVPAPLDAALPEAQLSGGVGLLLLDRQTRVRESARYVHFARRFVNDAGVDSGSDVSISLDPSYERATLHAIVIHRSGARRDALDAGRIRVLSRETDLERRLFDGRITLVLPLEDIRVGDVLEVAYTIAGDNPAFGGRFEDGIDLAFDAPVARVHQRLLWPTGRPLHLKEHGGGSAPAIARMGDEDEYVWGASNVGPVPRDEQAPSWYDPYPWIQVTEYGSWSDVARWALPFYRTDGAALPKDIVNRLSAAGTEEQKLLAALEFVQEEVRYLGFEGGAGSHRPNPPAVVLSRRFGDCKDKSLLLVALLRALGIEASPAFVSTNLRRTVRERLPSRSAFNHVVVRASLAGVVHWLDSTDTHQRGTLSRRSFPDLGFALVVAENTRELERLPAPREDLASRHVRQDLVARSLGGPADFLVEVTNSGAEADKLRQTLARVSHDELARSALDFHARAYPGIKRTSELEVVDDRQADSITVREGYRIDDFWTSEPGSLAATLLPAEVRDALVLPTRTVRSAPLALLHPLRVTEEVRMRLPEDWSIDLAPRRIENPYLRFTVTPSYADRQLVLKYELSTLSDHVPAAAVPAFARDVARIHDLLPFKMTHAVGAAREDGAAIHWPLVALVVLFGIVFSYAGYRTLRLFGSKCTKPGIPLGGWLVLLALGMVVNPVVLLVGFVRHHLALFRTNVWQQLTTPGRPAYHDAWGSVLTFELLGSVALLVASIVMAIAFFTRKRAFPSLFVGTFCLNVLFLVIDAAATKVLPIDPSSVQAPSVARVAIFGLLWSAYVLRSERARRTFVY